ncbi:hypothetical protein SAMN03159341_103387 [Paenibacillus sp. 1_12]|uniref:hypothetical protein n=1 Tax=Paenibacillus sp. 1_12 TaxID=1566278 RepID=UPI0008E9E337|nr:hypothetical protein [Paenibacillus sp. 1_12]SFL12999.1 hypothetical protein SAMN03159341_103387 [Paenibacillus sp. 1_12]
MFKQLRLIGIIGIIIATLGACVPQSTAVSAPTDEPARVEPADAPVPPPRLSDEELKHFNEYIPSLRGASLIKLAEIRNQNEAYIQFYTNYNELKEANPDTPISETEFNSYFPAIDAVHKTIMDISVRLLHEIPAIRKITLAVPFKNQLYGIDANKRSIEMYLKASFKKMHDEPGQKHWKELLKKLFTTKERDKFAQRFIRPCQPSPLQLQ